MKIRNQQPADKAERSNADASPVECRGGIVHGLRALAIVASVVAPACGDDPFTVTWTENPDTVQLYAISRPELNLFSAFDFYTRIPKRLESASTGDLWDLVTDVRDGQFVWLPAGALGITSEAAVATVEGETFESAARAPSDTARYVDDEPVPVRTDRIYVIRTRRVRGSFSTCNHYGKIEALETDPVAGTIRFRFDVNRICNDLALIPPD